jgi:hypothetical protein
MEIPKGVSFAAAAYATARSGRAIRYKSGNARASRFGLFTTIAHAVSRRSYGKEIIASCGNSSLRHLTTTRTRSRLLIRV